MHSRILVIAAFALLLSACPQEVEWTAEQKEVHQAMLDWSKAVSEQDGAAMWEMLSPDAKDVIRRELEGTDPPGARATVKMSKAALKPEARTTPERRKELEELLKKLPEDPDNMTAKDYYIWKVTPDLTQDGAARTAQLFEKSNVSDIEINGEKATVVLKNGQPDRYSWVRHDGVWKFDLPPSILRALEDARKRAQQEN